MMSHTTANAGTPSASSSSTVRWARCSFHSATTMAAPCRARCSRHPPPDALTRAGDDHHPPGHATAPDGALDHADRVVPRTASTTGVSFKGPQDRVTACSGSSCPSSACPFPPSRPRRGWRRSWATTRSGSWTTSRPRRRPGTTRSKAGRSPRRWPLARRASGSATWSPPTRSGTPRCSPRWRRRSTWSATAGSSSGSDGGRSRRSSSPTGSTPPRRGCGPNSSVRPSR